MTHNDRPCEICGLPVGACDERNGNLRALECQAPRQRGRF